MVKQVDFYLQVVKFLKDQWKVKLEVCEKFRIEKVGLVVDVSNIFGIYEGELAYVLAVRFALSRQTSQ